MSNLYIYIDSEILRDQLFKGWDYFKFRIPVKERPLDTHIQCKVMRDTNRECGSIIRKFERKIGK